MSHGFVQARIPTRLNVQLSLQKTNNLMGAALFAPASHFSRVNSGMVANGIRRVRIKIFPRVKRTRSATFAPESDDLPANWQWRKNPSAKALWISESLAVAYEAGGKKPLRTASQ